MSREGSSERRKSASPRIPVDLLVELCAAEEPKKGDRMLDSWSDVGDAFADAYDADGLDLSATGLRLRSAVLPDVGQRLRCRFDLPEADQKCEAEGRVVWSNDAGRHGEFGLRFESLAPAVESALARWAMDRGPTTLPGTEPAPEPITRAATSEPKRVIERAPKAQPFGMARVRFDGVASAIEAEVTVRDELRMDVEQALPFFELGRLASVEADGGVERRRLEHVSLRIENGVPKLVLGLVAEISSSAGELAAPSMDDASDSTLQDEELEQVLARSTASSKVARVEVPEVREEARVARAALEPEAEERIVETRSSSSGAWVTDREDEASDEAPGETAEEAPAEVVAKTVDKREAKRREVKRELFGSAEDSLEDADPRMQAQRKKKLDEVRRVLLDGEELPEAPSSSAGSEKAAGSLAIASMKVRARMVGAAIAPSFSRLATALRTGWATFVAGVGPRSKAVYAAVAAWIVRVAGLVSERIKTGAPRLAALLTRGKSQEKRRTTAPPPATAPAAAAAPRRQQKAAQASVAPEAQPSRPRLPLRYVLLAVVALGAVGSMAYAFGGGSSEPAPIVVPASATPEAPAATDPASIEAGGDGLAAPSAALGAPLGGSEQGEPSEGTTATTLTSASPATSASTTSVAALAAPSEPSALSAPSTDEGRLPMPGYPSIGRAGTSPSTSTTSTTSSGGTTASAIAASTVAAPAPAPGPVTTGRTFGSDHVEGGQTTSLRMSLAPSALEGQADAHGFTVTIRGALSLDRAATIARSNPAVDRASILNRGDHAVLDVRFVEGRSPAYHVEIHGETVDVTIGR
ncbi:MAG: PilZ domain-containing protein [Sandaracinus sp.]